MIYYPFAGRVTDSSSFLPASHCSEAVSRCYRTYLHCKYNHSEIQQQISSQYSTTMPPSRPKPSEIAVEAKRIWMPHIWKHYIRDSKTSYLYPDSAQIRINVDKRSSQRTRVAVMEGDPVNYALGWYQSAVNADPDCKRIPVINVANEKRAGGDWESGLMAPEECFARRSNLVHALTMPWNAQLGREENYYPIPQTGGIYSPEVCMLIYQQRSS